VTRFVVDCDTLLRIAVAPGYKLVGPTLVRSQIAEGLERLRTA